jgi:tetratricopeptide (TPR) repeat protein
MDPTLALALNARGYAHLRLFQYREAINDCSQAIKLNPKYANAYHNRSAAKRALGDSAGAKEDLRRGIELENVAACNALQGAQATVKHFCLFSYGAERPRHRELVAWRSR